MLAHRDCGHIFKRFDEIFFINSTGSCFFTCEERKRTIHRTCSLTALQHVCSISYWLSALRFQLLQWEHFPFLYFPLTVNWKSLFVDKTRHLKTSSLFLGNTDKQFWPFSDILWTQQLIYKRQESSCLTWGLRCGGWAGSPHRAHYSPPATGGRFGWWGGGGPASIHRVFILKVLIWNNTGRERINTWRDREITTNVTDHSMTEGYFL